MAQLLPQVIQQFFDRNGAPLAGGKIWSYEAGTNTPKATFTDATGENENTNPVVLNGAGMTQVWIDNSGYKLVLMDSIGVVQWTVDGIFLIEANSINADQIADGAVGTDQLKDRSIPTSKIQLQAITTELLADGNITTGKIATGAITISLLDPNLDLTQLNNVIEVAFKRTDDLSGGRLQAIPQYPWSSPSQQNNPATLPTGQGNAAKISPDGKFLAVAHNTSPFVTIYEIASGVFNKLDDPATLPAGVGNDLDWSPNGDFLVIAHNSTPFITIYQRQGINFTKLSDPATLPGASGVRAKFSPNGEFLAVSSTDFQLYNIKGTAFTSIVGASGINSPDGIAGEIAWSHDSQYLALSNRSGTGNLFNCYQRTGNTFTAMTIATQPATVPNALAFTPDGAFLIGGYTTSPDYMFFYDVSGSTLTWGGNPFLGTTSPAGSIVGISISLNGTLIAVVSATAPYLQIYSGSFFGPSFWQLLPNPANIPVASCNGVSFGPTTQWLACALTGTPYVQIYSTASTLPALGIIFSRTFYDV